MLGIHPDQESRPPAGPGLTDEELMERLKAGEREALNPLVERHWAPLVSYVRGLVGDIETAEDVVQETCLRILQSCGQFDSGERFKPWAFRIAHNRALDVLRKRARRSIHAPGAAPTGRVPGRTEDGGGRAGRATRIDEAEIVDPLAECPVEALVESEDRERTEEMYEGAVAKLSGDERRALELYKLGLSRREIAEELGRTEEGASSLLDRMRRKLRRFLKDREI